MPRLLELAWVFLRLGLTSFGGPVAHLAYFREELVRQRGWLNDARFADLVALCQFLPGPASSQFVFAIGLQRAGVVGGLTASAAFTLPSVVVMVAFALGLNAFGALDAETGWLRGLKAAAAAVVLHAIISMARTLCADRLRATLAAGAALLVMAVGGAAGQVGAIALGAVVGLLGCRNLATDATHVHTLPGPSRRVAMGPVVAFAVFLFLLLVVPALAGVWEGAGLRLFDRFYRAGSLVFGGGHVVLPLLEAELVPTGVVSESAFLAGYGAAQALPGPLFTFASFLGTLAVPFGGIPGAAVATLGIFLPGWLLVGAALPYWERLSSDTRARAALSGANAAVVGLLIAAFYDPVWTLGVRNHKEFAIALSAYLLLAIWKAPPWLVVLLAAAAGFLLPG